MNRQPRPQHGFSLIEIMLVVGVIGILGAVAVVGYQEYQSRARAADILVKYDAIRSGIGSQVASGVAPDCNEQAKQFSTANLNDPYANLSYGFQPAPGGFRPVLTVCSRADTTGNLGVKVAKGAMDTLARSGSVEPGALVSDSVVSFALPLTAGNKATCAAYTPTTAPVSPCSVTIASSATACPAGKESYVIPGSGRAACLPSCQPGQTRDQSANCVGTPSGSVPGATPVVVAPLPGSPAALQQAMDYPGSVGIMTTLAALPRVDPNKLGEYPGPPPGCTTGQIRDDRGQCRDLVCTEEVVSAPSMQNVNMGELFALYGSPADLTKPGDSPQIPPRDRWWSQGKAALGTDCLLCGDASDPNNPGCNELDIILGMTNKCPDTQPVCRNDLVVRGGVPVEFRRCVAIQEAIYTASAPSDCLPGMFAVPNKEGATCSRTCYGDGCNLFSPGVSLEGTKRMVCK